MKQPFISIVIPARNAEGIIEDCLKSLEQLDYPKDRMEVIIADGLSGDRTREIASAYGAKVIVNSGIRVVSGRNVGFEAAQGELIAFSDADCVMDKNWLKNCIKYFEDENVAGVGGPNLVPSDESTFSKAVGLIFDYAFFVKGGSPTKVLNRVIESRTHGSNSIYRADVLRRVMPVDEDMIEGEDVIMTAKINHLGYKLLYVPDVIVFHYRRSTPKKWWNQMYRYGLGRVLTARKMPETIKFTQIIMGLAIPILVAFIALSVFLKPLVLLFGVALGMAVALLFVVIALVETKSLVVALYMPLALLTLPIAWSCGFWRELLFPVKSLREHSKVEYDDRWRRSQITEENTSRDLKGIYDRESSQIWEAVLRKEFSVDFKSFKDERVLEVGCGFTGPIYYIDSPSLKVGIDPLLYSYRDTLPRTSTVHLVVGMVERLPLKDGSFNTVLCINTLDHVAVPQAALREIKRVIAPGGLLLLEVNVFNSLPKWVRGKLYLWDRPHPFHLSTVDVVRSLKQAGFSLLDYKEMKFEAKVSRKTKVTLFHKHKLKLFAARLLGIRELVVQAHVPFLSTENGACSEENLKW